jgi:uncharacterized protein YtpQ (UPF0354 family)
MRKLIVLLFIITISCSSQMKHNSQRIITITDVDNLYKITKIDSVNSFYFIYCNKGEKTYKIISEKIDEKYKIDKIMENKYYRFQLTSFPDYSKNDNPLTGFNSIEPCFMLDKQTKVCKEQGIELFITKNLKGLYYIE